MHIRSAHCAKMFPLFFFFLIGCRKIKYKIGFKGKIMLNTVRLENLKAAK